MVNYLVFLFYFVFYLGGDIEVVDGFVFEGVVEERL